MSCIYCVLLRSYCICNDKCLCQLRKDNLWRFLWINQVCYRLRSIIWAISWWSSFSPASLPIVVQIYLVSFIASATTALLTLSIQGYVFVHFFESFVVHYRIIFYSAWWTHRLLRSNWNNSFALYLLRLVLADQFYISVRIFDDRKFIVFDLLEDSTKFLFCLFKVSQMLNRSIVILSMLIFPWMRRWLIVSAAFFFRTHRNCVSRIFLITLGIYLMINSSHNCSKWRIWGASSPFVIIANIIIFGLIKACGKTSCFFYFRLFDDFGKKLNLLSRL